MHANQLTSNFRKLVVKDLKTSLGAWASESRCQKDGASFRRTPLSSVKTGEDRMPARRWNSILQPVLHKIFKALLFHCTAIKDFSTRRLEHLPNDELALCVVEIVSRDFEVELKVGGDEHSQVRE